MALFQSQLVTAASGSIGGVTFAHNAGGLYMRARVTPTDPSTPRQNIVRAATANLSNRWANILSQAARDEWNIYAENTPLVNKLGLLSTVSGIAMYIRSNVSRFQAGLPRVDIAPSLFDLGEFTPILSPTALGVGTLVGGAFNILDAWVGEDDSALLVYIGRPQNQSINFFKGPYAFAGAVLGDAITPPTSPFSVVSPFPFVPSQRIFFRVVVTRVDGRYSNTQRLVAIAV